MGFVVNQPVAAFQSAAICVCMYVRTTTTVWPDLVHSVSMYIGPGAERERETERGAIDSPQGKGGDKHVNY